MNLPYEIVVKILVEFDGRFVWRNRKLIFIGKLLKDDPRYAVLNPLVPHPRLHYCEVMDSIFPQVYLKFSPEKEYVLSLWFTETAEEKIPSIDVLICEKVSETKVFSRFIGTF